MIRYLPPSALLGRSELHLIGYHANADPQPIERSSGECFAYDNVYPYRFEGRETAAREAVFCRTASISTSAQTHLVGHTVAHYNERSC